MELSHAPVVQKFSAPHGVPKMRLPIVGSIHVGHRRGSAAPRHDSVSLSKKRLADHADRSALREGFDGRAQSRPTGANDENVVFAGFVTEANVVLHLKCLVVYDGHRSLRSRTVPQATIRI